MTDCELTPGAMVRMMSELLAYHACDSDTVVAIAKDTLCLYIGNSPCTCIHAHDSYCNRHQYDVQQWLASDGKMFIVHANREGFNLPLGIMESL